MECGDVLAMHLPVAKQTPDSLDAACDTPVLADPSSSAQHVGWLCEVGPSHGPVETNVVSEPDLALVRCCRASRGPEETRVIRRREIVTSNLYCSRETCREQAHTQRGLHRRAGPQVGCQRECRQQLGQSQGWIRH